MKPQMKQVKADARMPNPKGPPKKAPGAAGKPDDKPKEKLSLPKVQPGAKAGAKPGAKAGALSKKDLLAKIEAEKAARLAKAEADEERRRAQAEQRRLEEERAAAAEEARLAAARGRRDAHGAPSKAQEQRMRRDREALGISGVPHFAAMSADERNAALDQLRAEMDAKRAAQLEARERERQAAGAAAGAAGAAGASAQGQDKGYGPDQTRTRAHARAHGRDPPPAEEKDEESWDPGSLSDDSLDLPSDVEDSVDTPSEGRPSGHAEGRDGGRRRAAKGAARDAAKGAAKDAAAAAAAAKDEPQVSLRSPICAILGHVDTGKTSLLDRIRHTNIQGKEVGGITQQIGSTFFSFQYLREKTRAFPLKIKFQIPGILIIDTPGHESFANLRSRGSSLADIAILVVDIMHGLEPQTLESIGLLRAKHCPFVIALNKVDRLYEWRSEPGRSSQAALAPAAQGSATLGDFDKRLREVRNQLAEQGFNSDLWWKVDNLRDTVSIVPTSAHTEEGVPDLLAMLVGYTQRLLTDRLETKYVDEARDAEEMQCTVLEIRKEEGFGYTLDCILVNGSIARGDTVVIAGVNGPIVTRIKELLTPQEAREIREKGTGSYARNGALHASVGFKIVANDLEHAIAGTPILRVDAGDDMELLKECVMSEITEIANEFKKNEVGVFLHSSSLGAMEALITYLSGEALAVPISGCAIGVVGKNTVQEVSLQLERNKPEYACVLAFDVDVDRQAEQLAKELGVRIYRADIIYHLYAMFEKHLAQCRENRRAALKDQTVFPCVLRILDCFHNKDPLILGVKVERGLLRVGQPLCFPGGKELGKVEGMERDKKPVPLAKAGGEVAIKVLPTDAACMYGRTFTKDEQPTLYTLMTRRSIDILKEYYRDELTKDDWLCVKMLRDALNIGASE